jgi:tRNA pseudouridine55 synthase
VKRLFNANKAGHTGSLDPLATGVLPVCLGEATKLSTYLLDADKQYQVRCQLGILTDSGDSDGEVIAQQAIPEYSPQQLQQVLLDFVGEQQQIPPMFSALKHQGQPLYKLARQGIEIERKSRLITIYSIELLACDVESFTLQVACSKGTYIRTLVQDIAAALGSCGHVTMLRRTDAAGYDLTQALSLEALGELAEQQGLAGLDSQLLPAHEALPDWIRQCLMICDTVGQSKLIFMDKAQKSGYLIIRINLSVWGNWPWTAQFQQNVCLLPVIRFNSLVNSG